MGVSGPSSVTVLSPPAQAVTASATRSFSPSEVASGDPLTVTIRVADYGGVGQLTEEFPDEFTFVRSSPAVEPSGQTLTFNLVADPFRELHAHGTHHDRDKINIWLLGNP